MFRVIEFSARKNHTCIYVNFALEETMKGIICCYSNTGNTKLACRYIAGRVGSMDFTVHDIIKDGPVDFTQYDLVGFAAFADFLRPSPLYMRYIRGIPLQQGKPAFAFNTFGNFNGATLAALGGAIRKRGFTLIGAHALHTPENIATMICMGIANEQAPNEKELAAFNRFIERLDQKVQRLNGYGNGLPLSCRLPVFGRLIPGIPRFIAKSAMGPKFVDENLCTRCGVCVKVCPAGAVTMSDRPHFAEEKCEFCWSCYNHCPQKAIYTKKYRGRGHYPRPLDALAEKLRVG